MGMSASDSATQIAFDPASLISVRGASRWFKSGESVINVLKDTNVDIRPGEFIAIEGRSGSGKSTLMHALGALDTLDRGGISFEGREYTAYTARPWSFWRLFVPINLSDWLRTTAIASILVGIAFVVDWFLSPSRVAVHVWMLGTLFLASVVGLVLSLIVFEKRDRPRAQLRNKAFGFIFQSYYLLPELSVIENTMLAPNIRRRMFSNRSKSELRTRATSILESLGMGHRLKHRPSQLSGGERQRVAIARALMNEPRVLFADEPTGNLDAETGRQIMDVLEKLHRDKGQTIVMVTHDRALAREADRVLVLKDGKLSKAE